MDAFPENQQQLGTASFSRGARRFIFFVFHVQQVGYVAELFRGALKRLDLFAQLRLLGLLLAEHLVDISHGNCLLSAIYVPMDTSSTNGTGFELRA